MEWIKKGLIFKTENNFDWMVSHASVPIADIINNDKLRIYFGSRDGQNRSFITFMDVEIDNPKNILYIHDKPILSPGKIGCFDDNGVMPGSIVTYKKKKYLYYQGWNRGITVPYHNSIGLAIRKDNGLTFQRIYEGPIMDRTPAEPYFIGTPFVMFDNGKWKMWYLSSTGWIVIKNKKESLYNIKYTESEDGINWVRNNIVCIDYKFENEAIARPCVLKEEKIYKMWYCYRGSTDFRINKEQSYRIGYAESLDGIKWIRKDEEIGIKPSITGWDSLMIEYPYVYEHKNRKYMLYNGNMFGKSGIGYAILNNKSS